jgi:hypothetical protein
MDERGIIILAILVMVGVTIARFLVQDSDGTKLEGLDEIELPVMSQWRTFLVVVGALGVGMSVSFLISSLWPTGSLAILMLLVGSATFVLGGLWTTRRWRRIGLLRYTFERLTLQDRKDQYSVDLCKPYELFECDESMSLSDSNSQIQGVYFLQGSDLWGFSYGLTFGQVPRKNCPGQGQSTMLGPAARVVHERIRSRWLASQPAAHGPPSQGTLTGQ